jgi:2TM domain
MTDDPFARAASRVDAAQRERATRAQSIAGSWANTGFRIHAAVFIAVNLLLVITWAMNGAGYPWFVYPLMGWGIGLVAHYAAVERWVRRGPR